MSLDVPCLVCGDKFMTRRCEPCQVYLCQRCMRRHNATSGIHEPRIEKVGGAVAPSVEVGHSQERATA